MKAVRENLRYWIQEAWVNQLHALLVLYGLPIQAAGDLLDMESLAGTVSVAGDFSALRERASKAWQGGDIPTAMACYLAMRHQANDQEPDRAIRHESILSFAVSVTARSFNPARRRSTKAFSAMARPTVRAVR